MTSATVSFTLMYQCVRAMGVYVKFPVTLFNPLYGSTSTTVSSLLLVLIIIIAVVTMLLQLLRHNDVVAYLVIAVVIVVIFAFSKVVLSIVNSTRLPCSWHR